MASSPTSKSGCSETNSSGSRGTIVFHAPGAGRPTLRGSGIRSKTLSVRKAGRLTVHVSLTRASSAALRRRHRRLAVELHASFRATNGVTSAATVALGFR